MKANQFVTVANDGKPSLKKPVVLKTWAEFRKTGLFLIVNQLLHVFGWSLIIQTEKDKPDEIIGVLAARVVFRGFNEQGQGEDYTRVTEYMAQEAADLLNEVRICK
jgi:hypothetical protein